MATLDLRKTSQLPGVASAESETVFSGGGDAVASSTAEKQAMAGDSTSGVAGILCKSSTLDLHRTSPPPDETSANLEPVFSDGGEPVGSPGIRKQVVGGDSEPGKAGILGKSSEIKIYSWNVNGIRAIVRKGLFKPFVGSEQPDILCLQETKAERGQAEVDLAGYDEYWNSADKKGYSGTAIFTRIKPLAVLNGLPQDIIDKYQVTGDAFGDPNREGRLIAAEYDKFYIVTTYTPNAKRDLSRLSLRQKHWDPAFLAYCKQLESKKPVIFCGDFNVAHTENDLANPVTNHKTHGFTDEERAGFQAFLGAGFVDTLRIFKQGNGYYTWWSHFANSRERNVGWRIDYFLVSASLRSKVKSAEIHPLIMGSDHCPISITIDI
jgi:exodeoxyribonuclease III